MKTQRETPAAVTGREGQVNQASLVYTAPNLGARDWGPWGDPWLGEFDEPAAVRS